MWGAVRQLWKNSDGAVAPMVALSLIGLIAAGGIAFDYAHMAALHTELQDAADQAALAAATQLDGSTDARTRATAAAQSLLTNLSLFANDAGDDADTPEKVTIASVLFYQSYDDSTDTYGDAATSDSNARIVRVIVGGRTANFTLTPIVGAVTSGSISAEAAASLSSAVCNVPPLMICAPSTGTFPAAADEGIGIRLQPGPQTGAWAPGDYGYLDFGNGASGLNINLGKNNQAGGCVDNSAGIPTEPGNKASVTGALNSRFDLYPASASACDPSTGDYCPAENTRKDLLMTEQVAVTQPAAAAAPTDPGCGASGAKVIGKSNSTDTNGFVQTAAAQGFTRDLYHINGGASNFGDGIWDRASYFAALHSGQLSAAATWAGKTTSTVTRYDVYRWELADRPNRLAKVQTDTTDYNPASQTYYKKVKGVNATYTFTNQCAYPFPKTGTGVAATATQKDRRVLTVAAVDCTGLNGKSNVVVKNWIDVFLVEPSLDRTAPYSTGKSEIYGEIIGVAKKPDGQSAFQYYLRQRPRLIR
jgi:Flp pilus assembly protein TadG